MFTVEWKNYKPFMLETPKDVILKYKSKKEYKQEYLFSGFIDPNLGEKIDVTIDGII